MAPLPKSKSSKVSAGAKAESSRSKPDPLAQIQALETTATSSPFNPNPLLPLLTLTRHASAEIVHKAVWALHRVFVKYINENRVGGIAEGARPGGGSGGSGEDQVEDAGQVKGWVRERLLEYVAVLGGLVRDAETALRDSALPLLFSLLGPLSASISQEGKPVTHTPYFRLILRALFNPTPSLRGAKEKEKSATSKGKWAIDEDSQIDEEDGVLPADVLERAHEEYWAKFDDLRWAFFKESAYILQNERLGHGENLLGQLLPLTNLPKVQMDLNTFFLPSMSASPASSTTTSKVVGGKKKKKKTAEVDALPDWMATYESASEEDEEDTSKGPRKRVRTTQMSIHASIHSVASHTNYYTTLWETVLGSVRLDDSQTRRILIGLHGERGILGHMRPDRRVRVADWLGGIVDQGGAKAMLAMNGLFVLMTKYNLDYPEFYKRLYGLLDRNVLHVKYRARFFRLLDTFLQSALLPAALVASFIKRLSRSALTAPPAGIIIVIPFIYNLFKRHPGCMVMIQRHADDAEKDEQGRYQDPYDENDPSPLTSAAINSSCWELAALQQHYLPSVSTLAKVFTEVFTKPEYNMEDFLDHGYETLFATESNRKLKNPPALSIALESGAAELDIFPAAREATDEVIVGEDEVSRLWSF